MQNLVCFNLVVSSILVLDWHEEGYYGIRENLCGMSTKQLLGQYTPRASTAFTGSRGFITRDKWFYQHLLVGFLSCFGNII